MLCVRKGNQVTQIIPGAKAITLDGVQHPPAIFTAWSKEELANIFIFPYSEEVRDNVFYNYSGERYDIKVDQVIKVWDKKTAKDIAPLKSKYINQTETTARSKLSPTDWYVIKKMETNEAIPDDIATYRQQVRDAEASIIKDIKAKKSVSGIKGMLTSSDGNSQPAMHDWPEPLS